MICHLVSNFKILIYKTLISQPIAESNCSFKNENLTSQPIDEWAFVATRSAQTDCLAFAWQSLMPSRLLLSKSKRVPILYLTDTSSVRIRLCKKSPFFKSGCKGTSTFLITQMFLQKKLIFRHFILCITPFQIKNKSCPRRQLLSAFL